MTRAYRKRGLAALAILTMLAAASGCASRGFVRNEVGTSAEVLRAEIDDNRESIDRTQQDLTQLSAESQSTDAEHDQQIAQTQAMIEATEAELTEVRTVAESADRAAEGADERSLTLARMFADRSRYVVDDSQEIYFGFSSATIEDEHSETLQAVSEALREDPDAILVLEGRTDSTGDPAFNQALAQKRVDATRSYLVMEMGVPIYRIHGFSYGESRPDYDNEVPEQRQKNRSVKLLIFSPDPQTTLAALPE